MKFALLTLFFCLNITTTATAQYLSVINDGHYWIQYAAVCDAGELVRVEIEGDTLVDGLPYRFVVARYCAFDGVFGLVRANETNSKLWFREYGFIGAEERLIMDLDLSVGDTFNDFAVVTAVAQVDGRKVITFESTYVGECLIGPEIKPLQFIEGVGPNAGIYLDAYGYLLDCAGDSLGLSYQLQQAGWPLNDCTAPCIPLITNQQERQVSEASARLIITPSHIRIDTEMAHDFHLIIFNIMGRAMHQCTINKGTAIPIAPLNAGCYVATLYNENKQWVGSEKFIVVE